MPNLDFDSGSPPSLFLGFWGQSGLLVVDRPTQEIPALLVPLAFEWEPAVVEKGGGLLLESLSTMNLRCSGDHEGFFILKESSSLVEVGPEQILTQVCAQPIGCHSQ